MPGGPMPPGFFQVSLCPAPLITGVHQRSVSESQTAGYRLYLPSLLFTPERTCTHTRAIRFEPAHTEGPLCLRLWLSAKPPASSGSQFDYDH